MRWRDLLGVSYASMDCRDVCSELLRRTGVEWSDDPAAWDVVERIEDVRPGDVIGSDPQRLGVLTHTSVVVSGRGRTACAVTSAERTDLVNALTAKWGL